MLRRTFLKSMALTPFVPRLISRNDPFSEKSCILVDQPRGAGKTTFCLNRSNTYLNQGGDTILIASCEIHAAMLAYNFVGRYGYDKRTYGQIAGTTFYRGDARLRIRSLGDGLSIRGYRADNIIVDNLEHQDQEILDTVVAGMVAPSGHTLENVKRKAEGLNPLPDKHHIIMCGTNTGEFTGRIASMLTFRDNQHCLYIDKSMNIQDYIGA